MALPDIVIDSDHDGIRVYDWHVPPILAPNGSVYVIVPGDSSYNSIAVYKNTNPGTASWSEQDSANSPSAGIVIECVDAVLVGEIIHMVWSRSNTDYEYHYHTFDTGADTWNPIAAQSPLVQTTTSKGQRKCSIHAFGLDHLVIIGGGPRDRIMGKTKARGAMHYSMDGGNNWTVNNMLLSITADYHYYEAQGLKVPAVWGAVALYQRNTTVADIFDVTTCDSLRGVMVEADMAWNNPTDFLNEHVGSMHWSSNLNFNYIERELSSSQYGSYVYFIANNAAGDGGYKTFRPTGNSMLFSDEIIVHDASVDGTLYNSNSNFMVYWDGEIRYYYIRSNPRDLHYHASTDGGATWGAEIKHYDTVQMAMAVPTIFDRGNGPVLALLWYGEESLAFKKVWYHELSLTEPTINELNDIRLKAVSYVKGGIHEI